MIGKTLFTLAVVVTLVSAAPYDDEYDSSHLDTYTYKLSVTTGPKYPIAQHGKISVWLIYYDKRVPMAYSTYLYMPEGKHLEPNTTGTVVYQMPIQESEIREVTIGYYADNLPSS